MTNDVYNLVSIAEAVEITGHSATTLRYHLKRGTIKGRKAGKLWFVDRQSLLDYKARMDALGSSKHNPWKEPGKGRRE